MKKLLIVGTLITSALSYSVTTVKEQETNSKEKIEMNNARLQQKNRLEQIMRSTSSDRK
ncbi:MAG: hypothetical protein ACRC6K_07540 [Fusobacteriaceae bacterium]